MIVDGLPRIDFGSTNASHPRAGIRMLRREDCSVTETAVGRAGLREVTNARVTGRDEHRDALKAKFEPFVAL